MNAASKAGKQSVPLAPAGENKLEGAAEIAAAPSTKIELSVTFPGERAQKTKFTPFVKRKGAAQ